MNINLANPASHPMHAGTDFQDEEGNPITVSSPPRSHNTC